MNGSLISTKADQATTHIASHLPSRPGAWPAVSAVVALFGYQCLVLRADKQWAVVGLIVVAVVAVWAGAKFGLIKRIGVSFAAHENLAAALCVAGTLVVATVFHDNSFVLFLLATILLSMTACLGLNVQFGYAGMLNFAGAAMMGIGAYTAALFGGIDSIPAIVLLPLGGVFASAIGSFLLPPMLRTQGHYSAVITIAFSLLFTTFLDSFQSFGGSQGLPVRAMSLFGWDFSNSIAIGSFKYGFYMNHLLLALTMVIFVAILIRRIERSWIGLNLDAVRIDETASSCFGIDINSAKIFAFTVGNFVVGMAGALYASMLGYIAPSNFAFSDSLILITVILLGGIGSIWGIVVTTVIVQILPERLQAIQEYRLLIYAVVVLLVLRFVPDGLIPRSVRQYFLVH
jgi:ABC-type branched-subunit amino acid transport system permease subunit